MVTKIILVVFLVVVVAASVWGNGWLSSSDRKSDVVDANGAETETK